MHACLLSPLFLGLAFVVKVLQFIEPPRPSAPTSPQAARLTLQHGLALHAVKKERFQHHICMYYLPDDISMVRLSLSFLVSVSVSCVSLSLAAGVRSPGHDRRSRGRAVRTAREGGLEVLAPSAAAAARGDGTPPGQPRAHAGPVPGEVLPLSHRSGGSQLLRVFRQCRVSGEKANQPAPPPIRTYTHPHGIWFMVLFGRTGKRLPTTEYRESVGVTKLHRYFVSAFLPLNLCISACSLPRCRGM